MSSSYVSSSEYPSILASIKSQDHENYICQHCQSSSSYSSSKTSSECFHPESQQEDPQIDYERFKTILQKTSSKSGDNLFDHLIAILKCVIDERPINVVDYFEQFSRTVRERKQSGLASFDVPQFLRPARLVIELIKPTDKEERESYIEEFEDFCESEMTIYQSSCDSSGTQIQRSLCDHENVLQTQRLFGFCGLGFHIDEVFQLSLSVQKVQLHPFVENARFWGRIYGLHGSYYIVEAALTRTEIENRKRLMEIRLLEELKLFLSNKEFAGTYDLSDKELSPGLNWQNYSYTVEDLRKMQQPVAPIPKLIFEDVFHSLEEPIGSGLNRKIYFVTTSLSLEWEELPTVAPKHIQASKSVKKYFTGDLNASLGQSFPGSERHYLRAMIARITSGTFIAPKGFYRKMTRKEMNLGETDEVDEGEDIKLDEQDSNDDLITRNCDYKHLTLEELIHTSNWVHVRPCILNQGRVLHLNEELALKNLENKAILSMRHSEEIYEDIDQNIFEDEELQEDYHHKDNYDVPEIGPKLFSLCNEDRNCEEIPCWTSRFSSMYNNLNKMILMRSNLWPGAYSIAFENFSDCIYLGWGFKYVARCTSLQRLPFICDKDYTDIAQEINDPTVEMEDKWQKYHIKKDQMINDNNEMSDMSDMSLEVDFDDED